MFIPTTLKPITFKSALAAGAFAAFSTFSFTTGANAAPALPDLSLLKASEVQSVHWTGYWHRHRWGGGFGYCRAWRHECAERWGWGTRMFYRCLRRHGC